MLSIDQYVGTRLRQDGDFLRVSFPLTPLPCWPLGHFSQPVRSLPLRFQFHAVMLLDFKSPEENEISFQIPVSHTLRPIFALDVTETPRCHQLVRLFLVIFARLWAERSIAAQPTESFSHGIFPSPRRLSTFLFALFRPPYPTSSL